MDEMPEKSNKKGIKILLIGVFSLIIIGLILYFALPWNILLSKNKMMLSRMLATDAKSLSETFDNLSEAELAKYISDFYNSSSAIKLNIESDNIKSNFQIISGTDYLAVKADKLYDKFILLDPNNLDTLWNNLELYGDDLPNKLLTDKDLMEAIDLTKKEQNQLKNSLKKYGQIIIENINEDDFVLNDNATILYKDGYVNAKSIEFQLSERKVMQIEKEILSSLKEDKSLDILIDKVSKLEAFYKDAGYNFDEINLTKEDVIKVLDDSIAKINETENSYEGQENLSEQMLVLRYYYNENSTPLKREILEKYSENGEIAESMIVSFATIDNSTEDYYELTTFVPSGYTMYYETISDTVINKEGKTEHNLMYMLDGYALGLSEETGELEWDELKDIQEYLLEISENKITFIDKNNENTKFEINIADDNLSMSGSFSDLEENSFVLKCDLQKNISKTKDDIKNEGALDLAEASSDVIKNEFNKIKINLVKMGLFAL